MWPERRQAQLQRVGESDVLMLQRFDRDYSDKGYLRFGLVSGSTVFDCGDSYLDRERWSYPLLADNLHRWSYKPKPTEPNSFGGWPSILP